MSVGYSCPCFQLKHIFFRQIKRHISKMEKVVKCEIKPGLPLIVPDNVYRMDSKTKITSFMRNKQIIDILNLIWL
jgi:hypothetical protein